MEYTFTYRHGAIDELPAADIALVAAARKAAAEAYAPITHFGVGAAARLRSGGVITAHNIESPIGVQSICAERNLLLLLDPTDPIVAMAIAARADAPDKGAGMEPVAGTGKGVDADEVADSNECYPCGVCRQAMIEAQARQGAPMRIIMAGTQTATVVENALHLLPFPFTLET